MKLIITIDLSSNDLEEENFRMMVKEALNDSATLNVEIGSSISEEEPDVMRVYSIGGLEYFAVEIQDELGDVILVK